MRRITKGRTAIAYSEYLLENISLAFRDLYDLPGPGSVRGSRNMENYKKNEYVVDRFFFVLYDIIYLKYKV
jgi:hypothetical protein